jgi:hypothetical protein
VIGFTRRSVFHTCHHVLVDEFRETLRSDAWDEVLAHEALVLGCRLGLLGSERFLVFGVGVGEANGRIFGRLFGEPLLRLLTSIGKTHCGILADGDALAIGAARDDPRFPILPDADAECGCRFIVVDASGLEPLHHYVREVQTGHFLSPFCLPKSACRGEFLWRSIHLEK